MPALYLAVNSAPISHLSFLKTPFVDLFLFHSIAYALFTHSFASSCNSSPVVSIVCALFAKTWGVYPHYSRNGTDTRSTPRRSGRGRGRGAPQRGEFAQERKSQAGREHTEPRLRSRSPQRIVCGCESTGRPWRR